MNLNKDIIQSQSELLWGDGEKLPPSLYREKMSYVRLRMLMTCPISPRTESYDTRIEAP